MFSLQFKNEFWPKAWIRWFFEIGKGFEVAINILKLFIAGESQKRFFNSWVSLTQHSNQFFFRFISVHVFSWQFKNKFWPKTWVGLFEIGEGFDVAMNFLKLFKVGRSQQRFLGFGISPHHDEKFVFSLGNTAIQKTEKS